MDTKNFCYTIKNRYEEDTMIHLDGRSWADMIAILFLIYSFYFMLTFFNMYIRVMKFLTKQARSSKSGFVDSCFNTYC
ncbi:hypothetical protein [Oceanobacillus senegalensis]|uniref:hypothetical protein n=1 Tax=Oceanobacillus senegalensis TaxID=1936063 RepID=UPI00117D38F5|nr:hypothetical protein [Oceanobacillus senegalensis]